MSTRRTRANPNPRGIANVQNPHVRIPNEDIPQLAIGTPSLATDTTQVNARVANPPFATNRGSSSLNPTEMDNPTIEDFGRDKDLKNLLKNLQPKAFTREETNIPKILKEWIMSMDDYFTLVGYNAVAQGIMGKAKLEGLAKLWWKLHCQIQGKLEITMGWGEFKESLKEWYLPLNYGATKMNEFLSCVRKGKPIN